MMSLKTTAVLTALIVDTVLVLPVNAQGMTLTGSVNQNNPQTMVQPLLRSQTAVYDTQARPTQVAPKRTLVKTVVVERRDDRTYFQKHPKVKSAAVGAGVGAGAGAVTGLISRRGVMRGAAIGAGSGAGVGLIRSSDTLKRHPIVRDVATGTVAGLGFGAAASKRKGTIGKSTAVGAAVGLGYSLLKKVR